MEGERAFFGERAVRVGRRGYVGRGGLGWGGVTDLSRSDSSESFHGGKKRFLWPCSNAKLSVTLRLNPTISLTFSPKSTKNRKILH